jgi:hypothetical protein
MDNKFRNKRVLSLLGFIALGALSGSAFAESAEYHRGYDQGYHDGIEAQGHQERQDESAARIIIEEASYGTREASCDLRDRLQQVVGRRRSISIVANNELCGDPAPNQVKRLEVRYRCGDAEELRERTREGGSVTLNCR